MIILKSGIYEQLVNVEMSEELQSVSDRCKVVEQIDNAEASRIISKYTMDVIKNGLDSIVDGNNSSAKKDGEKLQAQISLANKIIELIKNNTDEQSFEQKKISDPGQMLHGLLDENDIRLMIGKKSNASSIIKRPETSMSTSSLFTGAKHEPQMFSELKNEINSADRIDMLVSFIKWSGLRLIMEELRNFTENGGMLRIITTSYMGATDVKAIEELEKLSNCEIKISYDTNTTRLHAKAYIFYRDSGFTTAYVGSSNLSNAAITSGLEWNIKATAKDLPDTLKKISGTFESYWQAPEFEHYTAEDKDRLASALMQERYVDGGAEKKYIFDIMPYSYQQEILDKLQAEREIRHAYKNLVVAATGTGKTLISAFDYRRFYQDNSNSKCKLLFVAHREEILAQSIEAFRAVLKNPNFGELYVGSYKPETMTHLFVSVQTANSQRFYESIPADYYDFIIIDEFHHAAADTYKKLLSHFNPKILLGLTATPERQDGKSVLDYFNGRIAAEIRLPEAINRKLLCPFQYFGVSDTVDLDDLKWTRGGYDKSELTKVYSLQRHIADKRAGHIVNSLNHYICDVNSMHAIGFCVSVEHARYMAEFFNSRGISSIDLNAQSSDDVRYNAKRQLEAGNIKCIFVVDLYNEGVDIPCIDTVLFLRPTESLTVFLQQLGRGLRLHPNKECLTVLDFVGQANKHYNFEDKFSALLDNTRRGVAAEIKRGFVSVPKGCYIQLEKKAKDIILKNIEQFFSRKNKLVASIAEFEEMSGKSLTLANFLSYHHLSLDVIYKSQSYGFYRLCVDANAREDFTESVEAIATKAFCRIASIDSRRWIGFLLELLPNIKEFISKDMTQEQKRMLWMFYVTIWQVDTFNPNDESVEKHLLELEACPTVKAEIMELLQYKLDTIDFIDAKADLGFDCPLDVHCSYTKNQILMAMDYWKLASMRQGVVYISEKASDVFLITLNKSDKDYSPTTMYDDYSINADLFHWQSQSTTPDTSTTGKRYINHVQQGSRILLFVREHKNEALGTAPFTFLGTAKYVSHTGSRPMNVIWKLDHKIPAKYIKKTNSMIIG